MSWYDVLGIPPDASEDEIRHAYLAKAKQLHPDRLADAPPDVADAANNAMALLNEARRVLGDRSTRACYDSLPVVARTAAAAPTAGRSRAADAPTSAFGRRSEGSRQAASPGLRSTTSVPSEPRSSATEFGAPAQLAVFLGALEAVADWLAPHPRLSRDVTVPDVRRLPVSECFYTLANAGLHPQVVRLTAHPAPVDGVVVDQSPAPGSRVRRNSVLILKVWHPSAPKAEPEVERAP